MSDDSWIALRMAEGLRAAEVLLLPAVAATAALDAQAARHGEVLIAADDVVEFKRSVEGLSELCVQLAELCRRLPDGDLMISHSDLTSAAADDLRNGIMDPIRARLAARVLPVAVGWPALARALRSTDTHTAWDDLTVGEMLTRFFDADHQLGERVLAAAELSSRQTFSSADANDLRRLAAALEEHAPAR